MTSRSIHEIRRQDFHYVWDNAIEPVAEVDSGSEVLLRVRDSSDEQLTEHSTHSDVARLDFDHVNPVSGPIYVKDAKPGDVLAVHVLGFEPRSWGWTALIPGFGLLADEFPDPWLRISRPDPERGVVQFGADATLPYLPFAGTQGVAPARPGRQSVLPPSKWGGNIDTRHVLIGSTLFLPVGVEGALFSLGDTHSCQGDGEVCGTAVETAMDVTLRLTLIKDKHIDAPQLYLSREVPSQRATAFHVCMGVGPDLTEAARDAVRAAISYLVEEHGLEREAAYALCSVAADLRIHEIVDTPNWVVGCHVPLDIFGSEK